jgi:hypothetical protein
VAHWLPPTLWGRHPKCIGLSKARLRDERVYKVIYIYIYKEEERERERERERIIK